MKYDEFIGQVQARARLASNGEAVKATRATLEILGERLFGDAAANLAAELPEEIGLYLRRTGRDERFDVDEFYRRVSEREGMDLPVAVHHARAVLSVVREAVSAGQMGKVQAQLPDEFAPLFESGSEGQMQPRR